MSKFSDNIYMAGTIAKKDIVDAIKNKSTFFNLILMAGLVVFFYWMSTLRPWDKMLEGVVFDEGDAGLFEGTTQLSEGYEIDLFEATSFGQMQRNIRHERLGLVIPLDFEQKMALEEEVTITGYVIWRYRYQVAELEELYSEKLSEMFEHPIRVSIGENILLPSPEIGTNMINDNLFFVTIFVAVMTIPALMLEEKLAKTLDALLVSPASFGQVVMGKALAGLFFVVLTGGLFFALNWVYITNWTLALFAFLLCAMFSIALGLAIGSLLQTPQKAAIWMAPVMIFFIVPTVFVDFISLAPGLRAIFTWIPSTAIVKIIQYSFSSSVPIGQLLAPVTLVLVSTTILFAVVRWRLRKLDR